MDGLSWLYVPDKKTPFFRMGYYSNIAPPMAPSGQSATYLEVAYREKPDNNTLLERCLDALGSMGILQSAEDVLDISIHDIPCAYVLYDAEYKQARGNVLAYLRDQDIFSIGRYGSWEYCDMEDSFLHAKEVASFLLRA